MANLTPEVLDKTLARQIEMPTKLWGQVCQAAKMDGVTPNEFCSRRMAAVVEEQLRREAERRRRLAEPKPFGRLRHPGGIR